jgi:methylmalonyl-CoA mutase, C-terminal domain
MTQEKVKVLMAKPGLEGHWRGLISVSQAFRDAGFEVIYGASMRPTEIAATALQEDVDIVGLSILCSNYMELVTAVMKELKTKKKDDVIVLLGGIIYEEDFAALHKMGVKGIYIPGTPLDDIVASVRQIIAEGKNKVAK